MGDVIKNHLVVMPAFNEAARIGDVVRAVRRVAPVVVIDDGSVDGTGQQAEAAGTMVLRQPSNQGKGCALERGCSYAREQGYAVVITMDADGQHDPADLDAFLQMHAARPEAMLIGDRTHTWRREMPWVRRWTNRGMSWLLSRRIGYKIPDTQCGYRLYPVDALSVCVNLAPGFAAESEILIRLARAGIPILSVPIRTIYGDQQSKIQPGSDMLRFFRMLRQV